MFDMFVENFERTNHYNSSENESRMWLWLNDERNQPLPYNVLSLTEENCSVQIICDLKTTKISEEENQKFNFEYVMDDHKLSVLKSESMLNHYNLYLTKK